MKVIWDNHSTCDKIPHIKVMWDNEKPGKVKIEINGEEKDISEIRVI